MDKKIKVLINTSTYKEHDEDEFTDVINSLTENMILQNKNLKIRVLKPMSTAGLKLIKKDDYEIYCYRYFWPNRKHIFSNKGIVPAIQKNYLYVLQLIALIISQTFSLSKQCLKFRPDYIYAHWFLPQAFISALVSKLFGVNMIFTTHGADVLLLNKYKYLNKIILNFVLKNTYKFTANSNVTLEQITTHTKTTNYENKYAIIPMGIDKRLFDEKYINKAAENNFLYIGRLIDYKGVDILLKSLELFKKNGNSFKLDILGAGIEEENLKELSIKLGLKENVFFRGFQNYSSKVEYIKNCDVFFVTSKQSKSRLEGGPLTLIEAMALEKFCIVSDSVGFAYYLNNDNSLLFQSGSANSLSEKLIEFKTMSEQDKDRLSKNAYETAKFFSFDNIAKLHNDFFFG